MIEIHFGSSDSNKFSFFPSGKLWGRAFVHLCTEEKSVVFVQRSGASAGSTFSPRLRLSFRVALEGGFFPAWWCQPQTPIKKCIPVPRVLTTEKHTQGRDLPWSPAKVLSWAEQGQSLSPWLNIREPSLKKCLLAQLAKQDYVNVERQAAKQSAWVLMGAFLLPLEEGTETALLRKAWTQNCLASVFSQLSLCSRWRARRHRWPEERGAKKHLPLSPSSLPPKTTTITVS